MTTLSDYQTQTLRLLHDAGATNYSTSDVTAYINESRNQLALDTECVRLLWAYDDSQNFTELGSTIKGSQTVSGLASTANIVPGMLISVPAGGAPFLNINAQVTAVPPQTAAGTITMNVPARQTANATIQFTPQNLTVTGQETYAYPQSVLVSKGFQDVIQVKSVSINWGGALGVNQYMLEQWSFSNLQAFLRFYGPNFLSNPAAWTCYETYIMLRPIPSQPIPMQWDTVCSVVPMVDNTTPEAIPYAYTDAVKYHAAYLAFLNSQKQAYADKMFQLYERYSKRARQFRQRTFVPYIYR